MSAVDPVVGANSVDGATQQRWRGRLVGLALALAAAGPALAWSNHALGTHAALAVLPEVAALAPLRVEPIEAYLADQAVALEALLEREEAWARVHVPHYPARPEALRFRAAGATPAELRQRFVAAVRINPEVRLNLYLQAAPGQGAAGRPTLPWQQVTTLPRDAVVKAGVFVVLDAGAQASVLDVVASASDEPDYGMDIGLWADNGTAHGKVYGMGKQPFGNPALDYSSQAPLHMGFFHESAIVYAAAGFLERTYPEARAHLWRTLAAHALASGHDYWGWRFAGWALHYVQDLTQPFHATVLPGVGVPRMLWINALDLVGWHAPKEHAITLVSNRHLALEDIQRRGVNAALLGQLDARPLLAALADTRGDRAQSRNGGGDLRQGVSRTAHGQADATDAVIAAGLPAHYVADPAFDYGAGDPPDDLWTVLALAPPAARSALLTTLGGLLAEFGRHTRGFVRALLEPPAR